MKHALLTRAALVLVSVALTLVVVEFALRVVDPAFIHEAGSMYLRDAEIGYTLRPHFTDANVRTNSLGLRGPEPRNRTADGRPYRVMLLGDSFTFGDRSEHEAIAAMTESVVNAACPACDIETINAGINGYDTRQELIMLRRLAPTLKPQMVVLVFFVGNDIGDFGEVNRLDVRNGQLTSRASLKERVTAQQRTILGELFARATRPSEPVGEPKTQPCALAHRFLQHVVTLRQGAVTRAQFDDAVRGLAGEACLPIARRAPASLDADGFYRLRADATTNLLREVDALLAEDVTPMLDESADALAFRFAEQTSELRDSFTFGAPYPDYYLHYEYLESVKRIYRSVVKHREDVWAADNLRGEIARQIGENEALLREFVRLSQGADGVPPFEPFALIIPNEFDVDEGVAAAMGARPADAFHAMADWLHATLGEAFTRAGVPHVDLRNELRVRSGRGERLYIAYNTHWNTRGVLVGARALAAPIMRRARPAQVPAHAVTPTTAE